MDHISTIKKLKGTRDKSKYLHSENHLLADELSKRLADQKHFAFYLKMATLYPHDWLRKLAMEILENKNAKTPGKLFAYLIKKHNQEHRVKNNEL